MCVETDVGYFVFSEMVVTEIIMDMSTRVFNVGGQRVGVQVIPTTPQVPQQTPTFIRVFRKLLVAISLT